MLHHFLRTPSTTALMLSLFLAGLLSSSALAMASRRRTPAKKPPPVAAPIRPRLPSGFERHHDTLIELEDLRKKKLALRQQGRELSNADIDRRQELKLSLPGYAKRYDDEPGVYGTGLNSWSNQYKKITVPAKQAKPPAPGRQQEPDNEPAQTQKRWWKRGTSAKTAEEPANKAPQAAEAYPPAPGYGAYPPPPPMYLDPYGRPVYPPQQPSLFSKVKGVGILLGGLGAIGGTTGGVVEQQTAGGGGSSTPTPQPDPGATGSGQSNPNQNDGSGQQQQPAPPEQQQPQQQQQQFYQDANGNWVNQYGQIVDQSGNPIPQ